MTHRRWVAGFVPAALALGGAAMTANADGKPTYYAPAPRAVQTVEADICVYGGNAAGIAAAVQASRSGKRVVVLNPAQQIGGLTTGGLSCTDFGNKAGIGGISREFYRACGARYGVAEEWNFEPHVAAETLAKMAADAGVEVRNGQYVRSVRMQGGRIAALTTTSGLTVRAGVYIDCSYEGDLMARAGVTFTVGREANSTYGETLNGVQLRDKHQFEFDVDPYVRPGDPASGLLPGIDPAPLEPRGTGDKRVQAYNFRMCLTRSLANRLPFPKPRGYRRDDYELLARYLKLDWKFLFGKFDPIRGDKVDKNNHGALSTDWIGMNHRWPAAGFPERERIFQAHVRYQMGWFWFLCNDPAVPDEARAQMSLWGLCRDEFQSTGGWPHQLYIREARRMVSDYVATEADCTLKRAPDDSIGLGAYGMDSHNCRRTVVDGAVRNEGDVQVGVSTPYPVSYRSITPRRGECGNLLVPVCLSASHIAYGSIRMEPVFMIMAQSAALAAVEALERKCMVQDVPYAALRTRLEAAGQVLAWKPQPKRKSAWAGGCVMGRLRPDPC